jgi:hypothetical protein
VQTRTEFRLLVVFNLLLIPAAWMVASYDVWLLPPQLQAWVASRGLVMASPLQSLAGTVGFAAFVALCIGLVGMLAFWRWARALTLWGTIVIYLPLPIGGPAVVSGFAYTLDAVAAILWGVLLACAYWSPAAASFRPPRRAMPAPATVPPPVATPPGPPVAAPPAPTPAVAASAEPAVAATPAAGPSGAVPSAPGGA